MSVDLQSGESSYGSETIDEALLSLCKELQIIAAN